MRKSGEKVEGDADGPPQTAGVHESSRGQVLRFSASLIHRCRSLVGSVNRPKRFPIQADTHTDKVRRGQADSPAGPPTPLNSELSRSANRLPSRTRKKYSTAGRPVTRCVAKFYISCSHAAAARWSPRSAKRRRSSADATMRMFADLPSRRGARPDQRRRLMTGPKRSSALNPRRRSFFWIDSES
jgi:hypothetical protein